MYIHAHSGKRDSIQAISDSMICMTSYIMLLLIIISSILMFVDAVPNYSASQIDKKLDYLVNQISNIPAIDEIRTIKKLEILPSSEPPEDANLTTLELVKKYGYDGQQYEATTVDGYILGLHRVNKKQNDSSADHTHTHKKKPVAFVMHGLLLSSAVWVLSGPEKSLGFLLADAGYDVWLGNARGNLYSRKHVFLSTSDEEYWDFSWHEIGTRDLPAMIDRILETTGQEKLLYLGHSQGTTAFFVMASEVPKYQNKIQAMFAMAPVAYCGRMKSPPLQLIASLSGSLNTLYKLFGSQNFDPSEKAIQMLEEKVCAKDAISQPLCTNAFFLLTGFDHEQLNKTLVPIILGHVPAGSSTKQIIHYTQLINSGKSIGPGRFGQYDYGFLGNIKIYGWSFFFPPSYNLSKIQVPVYLHYADNDWLANPKDVYVLDKELANSSMHRVPFEKFNHVDFIWAIDVVKLLYDKLISQMKNFLQ